MKKYYLIMDMDDNHKLTLQPRLYKDRKDKKVYKHSGPDRFERIKNKYLHEIEKIVWIVDKEIIEQNI